mmetsp:Transcript_69095/g.218545  ORF Transcript_69095/g.218545 Transcript_69095/m.218545 type:complete len:235 (+) Transcript_69095:363-1067(+)
MVVRPLPLRGRLQLRGRRFRHGSCRLRRLALGRPAPHSARRRAIPQLLPGPGRRDAGDAAEAHEPGEPGERKGRQACRGGVPQRAWRMECAAAAVPDEQVPPFHGGGLAVRDRADDVRDGPPHAHPRRALQRHERGVGAHGVPRWHLCKGRGRPCQATGGARARRRGFLRPGEVRAPGPAVAPGRGQRAGGEAGVPVPEGGGAQGVRAREHLQVGGEEGLGLPAQGVPLGVLGG